MTTAIKSTTQTRRLKLFLSVGLSIASVGGLLLVRAIVPSISGFTLHNQPEIDTLLKYQVTTLGMTFVFLLILHRLQPHNFQHFAHLGDSQAHPEPVKWLSIKATDTWRGVGTNFAVIITVITAIFIYLNVLASKLPNAGILQWLPLVVLLASSNAFVEEALVRFGIVVSLHGILPNPSIYLISALAFGLPHYFGTPGGLMGVLMAAFLGWLLSKSLVETRGVFWAWFIHFLQDAVIFWGLLSSLALV